MLCVCNLSLFCTFLSKCCSEHLPGIQQSCEWYSSLSFLTHGEKSGKCKKIYSRIRSCICKLGFGSQELHSHAPAVTNAFKCCDIRAFYMLFMSFYQHEYWTGCLSLTIKFVHTLIHLRKLPFLPEKGQQGWRRNLVKLCQYWAQKLCHWSVENAGLYGCDCLSALAC